MDRYRVTSPDPLPAGKSTIRVEFKYDGGGPAKGGTVTMFVNDKKVAEGRVEKTIFGRFSADETFDTGLDTGSPVSDLYEAPFKFDGTLHTIEIDIAPTKFGAVDEQLIQDFAKAVDLVVE
jgi:arylsulfatase